MLHFVLTHIIKCFSINLKDPSHIEMGCSFLFYFGHLNVSFGLVFNVTEMVFRVKVITQEV